MASNDINLMEWMSQIPENLRDTSLSEIAIPGSHDSFTSRLDLSSEIGPDVPAAIKILGPLVSGILKNWSITQNLSFTKQLINGIRYFDFRVATRKGSDKIHFIHSLYGTPVADGIDEIIQFLDQNKKEIVILDFNHFYGMSEDQHKKFLDMLLEKCAEKLCMYVGVENLTFNMLWENNLQIIIVYHHQIARDIVQVWPGSTCKSHWPETTDINKMISFLDNAKLCVNPDHFKVCQCVLTPDLNYILGNINGSVLENCAKKVMPIAINWVKRQKRGKCGINIVIADYIDLDDFAQSIVNLNIS